MYEACLEFPGGSYGWCVELHVVVVWWHVNCAQALKEYRIVFITYVLAENLNLHPSSSLQASF